MELDIIKKQTTWNDAVTSINSNFSKVRQAIVSLEVGGGGSGITLAELELYLTSNGYINEIEASMVVNALGFIPVRQTDLAKYALKSDLYGYALKSDVDALKEFFDGVDDQDALINKWHELEDFLEGVEEGDKLLAMVAKNDTQINSLTEWVKALDKDVTEVKGLVEGNDDRITSLEDMFEWVLDESGNRIAIRAKSNFFSEKQVAAGQAGTASGGGSGETGGYGLLLFTGPWSDYTSDKADYALAASLGYDLHTRVSTNSSNISSLQSITSSNTSRIANVENSIGGINKKITNVENSIVKINENITALLADVNIIKTWFTLKDGVLSTEYTILTKKQFAAGLEGQASGGSGVLVFNKGWDEYTDDYSDYALATALGYDLYTRLNSHDSRLTALEGKSSDVSYIPTLTSGKAIGTITIDGSSKTIYAPSTYAWSEITSKPTFATVATSGSYNDLSNKPTIATLMGTTAIGGASAYAYWNGTSWVSKTLGSNAFTSITKVSELTNDSGYLTSITKSMVEGVLTGNITSHTHSQYLTTHQSIYSLTIQGNGNTLGTYTPNSSAKTINITPSSIGAPTLTGTGASGTWGISISGNAATSTKFQTARTIWGQSFDGTANVSGNLSNVGNIIPISSNTYSMGNTTTTFNNIFLDNAIYLNPGDNGIYINKYGINYHDSNTNHAFDAIRIQSNGNVGIGTNSPSYKLDVNGHLGVTGNATLTSYLSFGQYGALFTDDPTESFRTTIFGNANSGSRIRTFRNSSKSIDYVTNQHDAGLAWASYDTHAFINVSYNNQSKVFIGGGNGDKLLWKARLFNDKMSLVPYSNNTYALGSKSNRWSAIYANSIDVTTASVGNTLTVSGATTLKSTLEVSGITTINNTLNVNGNETIRGALKIGSATISWDATNQVLKIDKPLVSTSFAAGATATSESISGTIINTLTSWSDYDSSKSDYALGAGLGKGLYDNIASIEQRLNEISGSSYGPVRINVTALCESKDNVSQSTLNNYGLTSTVIQNMADGLYTKVINTQYRESWSYEASIRGTIWNVYIRRGDGFDIQEGISMISTNSGSTWRIIFGEI